LVWTIRAQVVQIYLCNFGDNPIDRLQQLLPNSRASGNNNE